jgi:hypothetical protein
MDRVAGVPLITLYDTSAETFLVAGGYYRRFYPGLVWVEQGATISVDNTTKELELYKEPVTEAVMLAPKWDQDQDTTEANTNTVGGTWKEVYGLDGTGCQWLHQTDATASQTSVEVGTAYATNQNWFLDLYLYEHSATDYKVQVDWGGMWRLEIWRDGKATLSCKDGPDGVEADYKVLSRGTVITDGGSVFGRWLTISFWAMKSRQCLVKFGWGGTRNATGKELLTNRFATETEGGYQAIFYEAAPVVTVSDGAYVAGFRPFKYAATGSYLSLETVMHELDPATGGPGYTGALTADLITGSYSLRDDDCAIEADVVKPNGDAFGAGDDLTHYAVFVQLAANAAATQSPQWYFCKVQTTPETDTTASIPADVGNYVTKLTETLSLEDGQHDCTFEFQAQALVDPDTIGSIGRRHILNAYWQLWLDGTGRTAGYSADQDYTVDEQHGTLIWPTCQNRLGRLKKFMLSDAYAYDGLAHEEAVELILQAVGFVAADYVCEVDETARYLPTAADDGEPLYRFANGTTAFEAIKHICDTFSGWHLCVNADFQFHYGPADSETIQATFVTTPSTTKDNLTRQVLSWSTRVDTSQFYNQIWVVGEAENGDIFVRLWQRPVSWQIIAPGMPPTPNAQIGEQRKLIYIDPALNTATHCDNALAVLVAEHGQPRLTANMRSWFDNSLRPGIWVEVYDLPDFTGGRPPWQVRSIATEITPDAAWATYELLYKGAWGGLE